MNIQDYPNIRQPEFQNATPQCTGNWMSAWTLAARPMNLDDKQWADADSSKPPFIHSSQPPSIQKKPTSLWDKNRPWVSESGPVGIFSKQRERDSNCTMTYHDPPSGWICPEMAGHTQLRNFMNMILQTIGSWSFPNQFPFVWPQKTRPGDASQTGRGAREDQGENPGWKRLRSSRLRGWRSPAVCRDIGLLLGVLAEKRGIYPLVI